MTMLNKHVANQKNSYSMTESEVPTSPHELYEMLAIDATMLSLDDILPTLCEEECQRLIDAATVAATTVLMMAHVPDDWRVCLAALHTDREDAVREELKDAIYEALPPKSKWLSDEQEAALARVRGCTSPNQYGELFDAVTELEKANDLEVLRAIDQAFRLGYEIAHNPARLIFKVIQKPGARRMAEALR